MNQTTCPGCNETSWSPGPSGHCRECGKRTHHDCLMNGWCMPCTFNEPTKAKAEALALHLYRTCSDDGAAGELFVRPARLLAGSLLFGPDRAEEIMIDDSSPWAMRGSENAIVVRRFRESGIWRDGLVFLELDDSDPESGSIACTIAILIGAGLVDRVDGSDDAPSVAPSFFKRDGIRA